ncbi:zf-rbx1 domain containing protein [Stylonychia lemnae]|uniref:Zf-rbx1 domain containing protein n=1 Tax=Stylonychia lemnae TaxID=5949 RepID=A0A078ADX4_STYLE|nr:zf-rbx1 domain containing protein [Stylonychia lemnae]|eukprot:CDW79113.1 zf-rbx1 domain containing protein [Stylonychia lemnae]
MQILDQDEDLENQRQQLHIELMQKLPEIPANEVISNTEMRDQVCLICLGDILNRSPCKMQKIASKDSTQKLTDTKAKVIKLSCGNKANTLYHKQCLSQWLKLKTECPLCRCDDILNTHVMIKNYKSKQGRNSDGISNEIPNNRTAISSSQNNQNVNNNNNQNNSYIRRLFGVQSSQPENQIQTNRRLLNRRQYNSVYNNDLYYHMIRF